VERLLQKADCQVAIVGAGPAGAVAAAALAAEGFSVLLLDNRRPGAEKACAGGILRRALPHLPSDKSLAIPWQDAGVHSVCLTHQLAAELRADAGDALFQTVLRSEFDGALVEYAQRMGADVRFGENVRSVQTDGDCATITTADLCVRSKVVIGADGVNSVVARQCGLVRRLDVEPALVMRIEPDNMEPFRHHAFIDWDTPHLGYSWIFPKADHLSVGAVGCGANASREALEGWVRERCAEHAVGTGCRVVSDATAAFVPRFTSDLDRSGNRVLLVGDAAALVDCFTREGISWALWSGALAAKAISQFLEGKGQLSAYDRLLEQRLLPELRAATGIAQWFYSDPSGALGLMGKRDEVWEGFCALLRGNVRHQHLLMLISLADRLPPVLNPFRKTTV
jgi:geranylgeranyl reductase family protein